MALAAVIPAALLALTAGPALATPAGTLDQHQDSVDYGWSADANGDAPTAQTFTAGMSGTLAGVSLYCYGTTLVYDVQLALALQESVQIQTVGSDGTPSGSVLATGSIGTGGTTSCDGGSGQGWVDIALSTFPALSAGTQYAIVWPGVDEWGFAWRNAYAGGAMCVTNGGNWNCSNPIEGSSDYAFRTYMESGTPPAAPMVSITKSNSAGGPVAPGTSVGYQIGLSVSGTGSMVGVAVSDQLPAGIGGATGISSGGTYDPVTNRVTWSGLTLSPKLTLNYTAVVGASDAPGTYTNTATITQGPCIQGYSCSATSTVTVLAAAPSPSAPATSPKPSGGVGDASSNPTIPPTSTLAARAASSGTGTDTALLVLVGLLAAVGIAGRLSGRTRRR